jgi:polar amino acid transport system substrate-binding protein
MKKNLLVIVALVISLTFVFSAPVIAKDTLTKVKERGEIVIGVKGDYRPWGFLNESGKNIGMEIDMANDIAKRLGVKPKFVVCQSGNRNEFLIQGKIDLILATMSDNPKRRKVLGIVNPAYYSGGTAVLTLKSNGFKKWTDLKDKKVCGTQGAYYNRRVSELYGVNVVAFPGNAESLTELQNRNCVAFLQDSTLIAGMLATDPKWADYESPLPVEDPADWVMAVPKAEQNGPFGKFISDVVKDWHKTGYLIEMNAKWGLGPVDFLQKMNEKYK